MKSFEVNNKIHPTAILEGDITMGEGNVIGPHVVMQGQISLGDRNTIGPGSFLCNRVAIGNDCRLHAMVSVGDIGEMGLKGDRLVAEGMVRIGNEVTIREFVCVHAPVHTTETVIEDGCYLMNKSYVAHDCRLGKEVVLSAGVLLGGRVHLGDGVNVGMGATIHQRCHIGCFAMIGMQTPVTRPVLPYATIAGNPARIIGFNRMGASRTGQDESMLDEIERAFLEMDLQKEIKNPLWQQIRSFLAEHPESLVAFKLNV